MDHTAMKRIRPDFEECESKILPCLVFVFNGNGFAASRPDASITGSAAKQLMQHGDRAIQLATPAMANLSDFYQLVREIRLASGGQPIGLMGFSAGGTLAMRLSAISSLNVRAVMSYYGPPDLRDWLTYHQGDKIYSYVTSRVHFSPAIVKLLSGPSSSTAYIVSAFGKYDANVVTSVSTASFDRDYQHGQVFYYPGPHGVSLFADYAAFRDFLAHLPQSASS
jgi:pimeloyl-ACP methyl ester carboxylesterase